MIAIIDYDAGNLRSVEKVFSFLGAEVIVTRDSNQILEADKVVLPGVGAFGEAKRKLDQYHLTDTVKKAAGSGKPFLGICLGMQLLFCSSEESEGVEGLSILPGKILRIPEGDYKIPHMGWNSIDVTLGARLFRGISNHPYVYFVHSYYLHADCTYDVAATTEYGTLIHASVEHDNIFGCQFHPEKSGEVGITLLRNFAAL